MKKECLETDNAIISAISKIDDAFYDIESIKNDIRDIQYDLAELDRKLHEVTLHLREVQSFLGTVCVVPSPDAGSKNPKKTSSLND